jgi:hypothetical protein
MPGCFSPTEILAAWDAGADVVKVFPATALGPGYFKDVRGPLPHVKLMPTGGVARECGRLIRAGRSRLASVARWSTEAGGRELRRHHRPRKRFVDRVRPHGRRAPAVKCVTFGEIMLRLSPPGFERLFQSPALQATFGGGEANVAVSLAQFGFESLRDPRARHPSGRRGAGPPG